MKRSLTLSRYVKKRTGVPLGASHSMRNMLSRSLGAGSFPQFWQYWNPVWSYYLSRNVMRPLSNILPDSIAVLFTFLVSGALHDLAVSLVKWKAVFFFTPWFGLMGLIVITSSKLDITYRHFARSFRAAINLSVIAASLCLTYLMEGALN